MDRIMMAYDVFDCEASKGSKKIPIFLLHGSSWNKYVYRHVAQMLCKETGRRVFTLDGRNHGESADCDNLREESVVRDMEYFMEDKNIKKASFVCHSSSSIPTHAMAVKRPDLVDKLVLLDHLPYVYEKEIRQQFFAKYARYQNQFLKILDKNLSLKSARDKIISFAPVDKKGVYALHEKIAYDLVKVGDMFTWRRPLESQADSYETTRQPPYDLYEGELLVIRCENSQYVTDKFYEDCLQYNPKMKLVTIKDTTHLLIFEKTEEIVQEIKKFLNTNAAMKDN